MNIIINNHKLFNLIKIIKNFIFYLKFFFILVFLKNYNKIIYNFLLKSKQYNCKTKYLNKSLFLNFFLIINKIINSN